MAHQNSGGVAVPRSVHDAERRGRRVDYAREFFTPTPVASAFETAFADRFYAYVAEGGSPDLDAFNRRERTRRRNWCLAAGVVATTLLTVVLIATTPPGSTDLGVASDVIAAWMASAVWVSVPVLAAVRIVQRRFDRAVAQMATDRAAYAAYQEARRREDTHTSQILHELGIDL